MNTLGIYIYNADRDKWYCCTRKHGSRTVVVWGSFAEANAWPEDSEREAEEFRESLPGDDVTFTMAALH